MAAEGYHEPYEQLTAGTRDMHRALRSLMEELEAVDWYDQRIDAATDATLKAILRHNRDEEKEHAAMVLEWLRRHDPVLDQQLRTYLFKEGDIVVAETTATGAGAVQAGTAQADAGSDGSLGIGDLRGEEVAP